MKLMHFIRRAILSTALITPIGLATDAHAVIYGEIDFPQGASSFADVVIRYDNLFGGGPAPTDTNYLDPTQALGIPDYSDSTDIGSVTLGRGGLIELAFTDNFLTNSGDNNKDLHIFEIGPDVEDTFVAIRPTASTLALLNPAGDANGDGFFEIGKVFGSTSSIDLDAIFTGFTSGTLKFDAVQLIDDPNEGDITGSTVGADIDAVGAISSQPSATTPEPTSTLSLLVLGTLGAASTLSRRLKPKPEK